LTKKNSLFLTIGPPSVAPKMFCLRFRARGAAAVAIPRVRVEIAVPIELEHVAADLVGARLDHVADHAARDVAGVGRVVVGLDA